MKIKILKPSEQSYWYCNLIGEELEVNYYITERKFSFSTDISTRYIKNSDCVITELPESFCVKRCDDGIKWGKYIDWLNKKCGKKLDGLSYKYYGLKTTGVCFNGGIGFGNKIVGTEIHIDDMIKHIDYMERHIKGGEQFSKESQLIVKMDKILKEEEEEFDLTTNEGRLAYARQHYPIGTKYVPLYSTGKSWGEHNIKTVNYNTELLENGGIEGGLGFVYASGRWAEIIKEETNMNTQILSRQGLKEIHSVACPNWKDVLEHYGSRNPLEDYIELYQEEVNKIFNACTKEQLPIVSKYLKQDDGSVDVKDCEITPNYFIGVRVIGKYEYKSFYLSNEFNWEIKTDEYDQLCLIPTKKK
jgi:hypothetical protein